MATMEKKRKKRSRKSSSNCKEEVSKKRGIIHVSSDSIPSLVACSSSSSSSSSSSGSSVAMIRRTICLQSQSDDMDVMDWFILRLALPPDLTIKNLEGRQVREIGAFSHNVFHTSNLRDSVVLSPVVSSCVKKRNNVPDPLWGNSSFACLGPIIYTIGGTITTENGRDSAASNLVHYFDTTDMSSGSSWKQAPSMMNVRCKPQVVALDSKLYVFGCSGNHKCGHKPSCSVWAEVFNPKDGQWRPLPNPPSPLLEDEYFVVTSPPTTDLEEEKQHNNNKIVVTSDDKAYEFDVTTGCWTLTYCDLPCLSGGGDIYSPVVVDGVLYWFDNEFCAYDIAKGFFFMGPVQDMIFHRSLQRTNSSLDDELYEQPVGRRPAIVHLGGQYFCLLLCLNDTDSRDSSSIHCLTVKVSRTKERYPQREGKFGVEAPIFFLIVSVVSCQSYPINRDRHFLSGRIMMI